MGGRNFDLLWGNMGQHLYRHYTIPAGLSADDGYDASCLASWAAAPDRSSIAYRLLGGRGSSLSVHSTSRSSGACFLFPPISSPAAWRQRLGRFSR